MQQNIQEMPAAYGPPGPYMQQYAYNQPQIQQAYHQGQINPQGPYMSQNPYMQQQMMPPHGYPTQHGNYMGMPGMQGGVAASPSPGHGGGLYADDHVDESKLLNEDLDISIRNGFVRKVYGILSVQLLITFGIACALNVSRGLAAWFYHNPATFIVATVCMIASVCTLSCVPKVARKSPVNYILLGVIAVSMGLILGFATGAVDTISFTVAAGMTGAVTVAVSLFAYQTKYDMTGCGVYAFVGLIILTVFGFCAIFIRNRIVELVYASLGAALFSFYLIIDTQMIIGGKHRKYQYSIDDYCFAALSLYMDIVNLFTYILQIVAASQRD